MDFFVDFGSALQFIFWILIKKNITVGTGTPFQRQEVSGNKMQMGHPHTGDFNAMHKREVSEGVR